MSQLVIAIGQLHEAGLVYGNLSRNGVMITVEGYVFLVGMGLCVERGQEVRTEVGLRPPEVSG